MACVVGALMLHGQRVGAEVPLADSKVKEVNACTLLTGTEISRVIGIPVDNGLRKDQGFQPNGSYSSTCVWVIQQDKVMTPDPSAPLGGRSFVIVNAMQWPAGSDLARSFLQAFREAAVNGDIPMTPVPRKFGDEALWWGDGLAVRKGDMSFGVSVFIPDPKSGRPSGRPSGRLMVFEEQLAPYILRRIDKRIAE